MLYCSLCEMKTAAVDYILGLQIFQLLLVVVVLPLIQYVVVAVVAAGAALYFAVFL